MPRNWQQFHDYYFGVHEGTHTVAPLIDAGIVADDTTIRISRAEWMDLAPIQIGSLSAVLLYANQKVSVSEDLLSEDIKVRIKYSVPVITTLEAA